MSRFIGNVSAYAYAVEKGYTGTEEEFAELMASYATVGQTAVEAAQTATTKASEASQSATTATNKASEATTSAQTATNKAAEAQTSAQTASTKAGEATTAATAAQTAKTQTEAAASQALTDIGIAGSNAISTVWDKGQIQTENARAQAQAAATSATTASTKASEASASATTATTKATEAAASATSAAQSATAAQDVLDSIPADYSEMSVDVDKLQADLADDESKLFDMTNLLESASSGFTENGITATLTDDVLSLNGTSAGSITKDGMFVSPRLKPNTTYAFRILNSSGFNNGASISLRKGSDSIVAYGLAPGGTTGGTFTTPADISDHYWRIFISNNKSFSNAIGSFMLVEGDPIPTQFVPPMQPLFLSADCLVNENESLQ